MKNVILTILVIGIVILGFFYFKQKNETDTRVPWPETEPATPHNGTTTNNNPNGQDYTPPQDNPSNASTTKTYSGNGFKIDYPKDITVKEEDAEGGPYHLIYFGQELMVRYVSNASWFEQYELSGLELVGSKTVNGHVFKIYQGENQSNTLWLKVGTTGYALNSWGNNRVDINSFDLI